MENNNNNNKIIEFIYVKDDGSKSKRKLYIVHEDAEVYTGFDFNYLNASEQRVVHKVFDNLQITPPPPPGSTKIDYTKLGVNKAIFVKSYRTFKKGNIK